MTIEKKLIQDLMEDFEGHSIYDANELIKAGWPESFIRPLEYTIRSNPKIGPTGEVFDNEGNRVKEMKGVEALSLGRAIAKDLGASTDVPYFGRGRNGRHLQDNILKALKDKS